MSNDKKIGSKIDLLHKQKLKIKALDTKLLQEKKTYYEMENEIVKLMQEEELMVSGGKLAKLTLSTEDLPSVSDWNKLYAYIKKNNAWDLLQKRVSSTAFRARTEGNKKIPGVQKFHKTKVTLKS